MHGDGHHVGSLFARGLRLGHGFVDIGLMIGIARLTQPIDTPIEIRSLRIQRHRSRDQAEFAATGRRVDDERLGGILFGLVRAGLRDAVGLQGVPQARDAISTLVP